jgi:nucleotide-binding universal stress UspA family protein
MTARKILCALDFSPGSQSALQRAIQLAHEQRADLVVMHVWYAPPTGLGDIPIPLGMAGRLTGEAMLSLDGAVEQARAAGVTNVVSQLVQGVPGWAIVEAANQDPAIDLVVVGTHGRTGLARVLVGSVAEYIVRHAPCTVLVARQSRETRAPS